MPGHLEFERDCLPHYQQVEGLCRRMLGGGRAQDAAQETYARALRNYPTLQDRGAAKSWLLSIATRHCLDMLRQKDVSSLELVEQAASEDRESHLLGRQILGALQPRSRSLLILRHCLQLSYQEIALVLELPSNQVGVALQRARQEALRFAKERGMTHAV